MKVVFLFIAFVCVAWGSKDEVAATLGVQNGNDDDLVGYGQNSLPCICKDNGKCLCCFDTPLIEEKGCLKSKIVDEQIQYSLKISRLALVKKIVSLSKNEKVCSTLKRPLELFSVCLSTYAVPVKLGTASCSALEFFIDKHVVGTINFQCVDVRNGKQLQTGGFLNINKPANYYYKYPKSYVNSLKAKIASIKSDIQKIKSDLRSLDSLDESIDV